MRKISFLDIILHNNIKLYVIGDQVYTCNLQLWGKISPGLYLIMRFVLCSYVYNMTCITFIILSRVKYQMWPYQLYVWTLSVLIKYFASYLISRGLTSAYDNSYTCNNYNNYTPMPSSSTTAQVNSTKYHSTNKTQIDNPIQIIL